MIARTPQAQLRCAEIYVRDKWPPSPNLPWPVRDCVDQRIRVAYVSADFHSHATAALMAGLFELHDRERFEVFAISYGPDDGSPMRARLQRAFERFVDVREDSDEQDCTKMRALGIDIAIDLKGYAARPGRAFSRVGRRPSRSTIWASRERSELHASTTSLPTLGSHRRRMPIVFVNG